MSKGIKTVLIILIVAVFGGIGYLYFTGNPSSGPSLSSSLVTNSGQNVSGMAAQSISPEVNIDQISQEFLSQLLNIRSIKLRDDIFSSPTFISLIDFTLELIQIGNEGRPNPFAPFGIDYLDSDSDLLPGEDLEFIEMEESEGEFIPFEGDEFIIDQDTTILPPPTDLVPNESNLYNS